MNEAERAGREAAIIATIGALLRAHPAPEGILSVARQAVERHAKGLRTEQRADFEREAADVFATLAMFIPPKTAADD